jgi:hypothetical protein
MAQIRQDNLSHVSETCRLLPSPPYHHHLLWSKQEKGAVETRVLPEHRDFDGMLSAAFVLVIQTKELYASVFDADSAENAEPSTYESTPKTRESRPLLLS